MSSRQRTRVLVTGASGKTGALVVRELLQHADAFEVAANVRSDKAHQLMLALGVEPGNISRVDIAGGDAATVAALRAALQGCGALVICTSAVPQTPASVDYAGQVVQIDAARAAHVGHVVLVSSAGGCDPHHFLNHIGRGDILNWKRAAEQYLIASGLCYTVFHPNHLVDVPGRHQVVLGVDDELQRPHWRQRLKMPRGDLAALVVAALLLRDEGAGNRSVDVAVLPPPLGEPTKTLQQFKQLFADMHDNCDYKINDRTLQDAAWACH